MSKRIFFTLICSLVISLLIGCSPVGEVEQTTDQEEVSEPESEQEDQVPGTTEDDTIRVGAIWSLTGEFAVAGVPGSQAAGLAVEKINEEGGVLGKTFELVTVDAKGDQNETINAMKRLIFEEKVPSVIGLEGGIYVTASAPIAQEAGVPFLIAIGTSANLIEPGEYIFMTAVGDDYQGKALAGFAMDKLGAETVAVMTHEGDPYSVGLSDYFMEEFKNRLGEDSVLTQEMFTSGDVDFNAQLTRIRSLEPQPDVLAILANPIEAPLIAKQARDLGIESQFIGGDGVDSLDLIGLGGDAVEGMIYSTPFFADHLTTETAEDFVQRWKTKYGSVPTAWEAEGYDSALLMAYAIEKAGVVESDAIREAIQSIDGYEGATGVYRYVDVRTPAKSLCFIKIENGERVFLEEYTP